MISQNSDTLFTELCKKVFRKDFNLLIAFSETFQIDFDSNSTGLLPQ